MIEPLWLTIAKGVFLGGVGLLLGCYVVYAVSAYVHTRRRRRRAR